MWISILLTIGQQLIPVLVKVIAKEKQHGFTAADDTKAKEEVKAHLASITAMIDKGA